VSVTLSVNSPTGQTPQRIFTVNSLKDADLRKDVLLGISMMNNHIYGSKVPKNPIFGAWIGISSQMAISPDMCIRLTWNLTGSCGLQQRLREWSRMVVKQFQDGGRLLFSKSLYRHISAKNHPISMNFCTEQQILNWMNVTWSKMKLHWTDSEFDRTYFLLFKKKTSKNEYSPALIMTFLHNTYVGRYQVRIAGTCYHCLYARNELTCRTPTHLPANEKSNTIPALVILCLVFSVYNNLSFFSSL